jgi:hypothetical protein
LAVARSSERATAAPPCGARTPATLYRFLRLMSPSVRRAHKLKNILQGDHVAVGPESALGTIAIQIESCFQAPMPVLNEPLRELLGATRNSRLKLAEVLIRGLDFGPLHGPNSKTPSAKTNPAEE